MTEDSSKMIHTSQHSCTAPSGSIIRLTIRSSRSIFASCSFITSNNLALSSSSEECVVFEVAPVDSRVVWGGGGGGGGRLEREDDALNDEGFVEKGGPLLE